MLFKFSTIKFAIAVFEKFKAQSTARRVLRGYDRLSQHRSMPPSGIGLIMDIKVEEFVIGEKGLPDIEKIKPMIFAPDRRTYYGVGKYLKRAFYIGKEI